MRNIAIILGGKSEEHEVSIKTGYEVIKHIDRTLYNISIVVISQKGLLYTTSDSESISIDMLQNPQDFPIFKGPFKPQAALSVWSNCDCAFLALHGEYGEDGRVQGYLDMIGIPYTGSNVFTSALCMHKTATKKVLEASGIPTPPYSVYRKGDSIDKIAQRHGFPCFVKCPQSGSSKLLGRAEDRDQLQAMLSEFINHSPTVLVETTIAGDEFSCPVLENLDGSISLLPPVYIKPLGRDFFDFEAKYLGASEEIVPAPHSEDVVEMLKKTAEAVHKVLECRGLSRTDIILSDGIPYVLEVNTLPGFTGQSLFPKAYAALGGTFTQLITDLIEVSIKNHS